MTLDETINALVELKRNGASGNEEVFITYPNYCQDSTEVIEAETVALEETKLHTRVYVVSKWY